MSNLEKGKKWAWLAQPINIKPDEFNVLMSYRGELSGTLFHKPITDPTFSDAVNRIVYGFTSSEDSITWTVQVPESGDYKVAIHYTGKMYMGENTQFLGSNREEQFSEYGIGGKTFDPECRVEVSANNKKSQGDLLRLTQYNEPERLAGARQWLDGLLPLQKGTNKITLHFPELSEHQIRVAKKELEIGTLFKATVSLGIKSVEIVKPDVWKGMNQRAKKVRSDNSWLVKGKYGLFVHWSLRSFPLYGDKRAIENFEWGVNTFDVEAFTDTVKETGASWVTFTTCHAGHYFPAPIQALDDLIPGRTSKRDLLGDIADALNKRNITLLVYYNFCGGDETFTKEAGMKYAQDTQKWFDFLIKFTTEVSKRYGKHIGGWGYIDGTVIAYEYGMPWEPYAMAMKAGDPNALAAISFHSWASFTPFNEVQTADSYRNLINPIQPEAYAKGARYEGLQPHFCFTLDGSWVPDEPFDGQIRTNKYEKGGPLRPEQEYIDYFKRMAKANVPVTTNLLITQDVTSQQPFFNPKSIELMKKIRKAVKGK